MTSQQGLQAQKGKLRNEHSRDRIRLKDRAHKDSRPAWNAGARMITPGTGVAQRIRAYREDCKDEALRMMRSLMDQAGVSHGFAGSQGMWS